MNFRTLNPATGELLKSFSTATDEELEAALAQTWRTFQEWRRTGFDERTGLLSRAAAILDRRADELARLMALEMGKPVAQGRAELKKCALVCRYYAENGEALLRDRPHPSDAAASWVRHDPLGPVLAVMPWNFPFWQVFRCAAPALFAGNTVLLKHAPNTPGCALEIESIIREAGAPDGLFRNLFLSHEQASRAIDDPRVRAVSLTGSTRAGREIAAQAGRGLKPMVAELGGSDPFLVFADADLDAVVEAGVVSRCLNSGQSCIAAKRFLVEREICDRFTRAFVSRMASERLGDPFDETTTVGPLARKDLRDALADQVDRSLKAGARALLGGEPVDAPGFFYPATVLTEVAGTAAAGEELFGPVAAILPFEGEQQAVELANATVYGLGAALFTSDHARIDRLIPEIETGQLFVNGMVKSDPRLPFGGVKASGFGRELGRDGLLELTNAKSVWIA